MNQKTLIGLAVAALVAIVIAVAVNHSSRPQSESGGEAPAKYLVPDLKEHVNDVDKVVITGAESKPVVTLTRGANGWTIAEKNGFAADTGKLRELLLKLADAKLLEQKTSSKDKYAMLGVEDVSGKDAKSVEIELGGLHKPVKVVIGNSNQHGGTFVRRAGEAESWLASGSLAPDRKTENWLRKDLADVAVARVSSVDLTRPDGKSVRLAKSAEGDASFRLADVPKGREAGSDYTLNGPAAMLGGLKFEDAVPAKDAPPAEKPLKARFATFDGLVVDVTAWDKDGKDYAQLSASEDEKVAAAHADAEAAKAKDADAAKPADAKPGDTKTETPAADAAKDRDAKLAAIRKEVDDLNARFKDWTFVLPPYKYAAINKSPDDFLKPLEDKGAAKKQGADAKKAPPAKKPKAG
jgi:hypothetical protein